MTQSRTIAADDVTLIARRLPAIIPLCLYDGEILTIPDDAAAEIDALLADDDWRLPSKAELIAYAADKRWRVETGGITVAGASIDTSRDSQAMITGAYSYSQAHPEQLIKFKSASGWVDLDAATVASIATAVGVHVQACFAIEATIDAAIEAGTVTTFAEIDAAAWPA